MVFQFEGLPMLPRSRVPNADRFIFAGRSQQAAVWREGDRPHPIGVPTEDGKGFVGLSWVPDLYCLVPTSRGQALPVAGIGKRPNETVVRPETAPFLAGRHVPEESETQLIAGSKGLLVRSKCDCRSRAGIAPQGQAGLPDQSEYWGRRVPRARWRRSQRAGPARARSPSRRRRLRSRPVRMMAWSGRIPM